MHTGSHVSGATFQEILYIPYWQTSGSKMVKIAVVGAGIIGLSSAICIQRGCPGAEITLITEKLSPFITSDIAAGVWMPYLLGDTPEREIYRWGKATYDFLLEQWRTEDGGTKGISMIPGVVVNSKDEPADPLWKDIVFGFRKMDKNELTVLKKPSLKTGYSFVTFICEGSRIMPYFLQIFKAGGGQVEIRQVNDIKRELRDTFDIVVNCTGLGASRVVPDSSMQPKRGQIMRVVAPSLKWVLLDEDDDGNYIIPNQDTVVLGGTHQEGDWNTEVYPEDREFIKTGCFHLVPSLKHAPVYKDVVGLRPCRSRVRLEIEKIEISPSSNSRREGLPFTIIHNYGHGGSGLTLFWGCALHAAALVQKAIEQIHQIQNTTHSSDVQEQFHYVPKSKL